MTAQSATTDIPIDAIHADWRASWGRSIQDEGFRSTIENNPRFSRRLLGHMLKAASGSDSVGAPELRYLTDDDRAVFEATARQPDNLINMAGLVWYSNAFARSIRKVDVEALSDLVHLDALRKAVRLRHLAPSDGVEPVSADQLHVAIRGHGSRCLKAWSLTMPVGIKARIDLLMPRDFDKTYPVSQDHARLGPRILHSVADVIAGNGDHNG